MDPKQAYKYCLRCGAGVEVRGRELNCAACDYTYYRNPFPIVNAILITPSEEVLLVQRARDPFKGSWDIPGGFVETGENLEDALVREIDEELGLSLKPTELEYFYSAHGRYEFKGVKDYTIGIYYIVNLNKQPKGFTIEDDISDAKFFSLAEIPFGEIEFPSVKKTLRKLLKW